jgi:hypothetical protein
MTSGQDVSEFLDILGLVKSYYSSFFWRKKIKNREFFFVVLRTPQRIRRFPCLKDCLRIGSSGHAGGTRPGEIRKTPKGLSAREREERGRGEGVGLNAVCFRQGLLLCALWKLFCVFICS